MGIGIPLVGYKGLGLGLVKRGSLGFDQETEVFPLHEVWECRYSQEAKGAKSKSSQGPGKAVVAFGVSNPPAPDGKDDRYEHPDQK